jgi:exonuclease V
MSCHEAQTEASRHALDHDSSDYGSDFTVDEEELLNELLARAVATEQTTTTTATAIEDLATPPPQAAIVIAEDLSDLKPLQEPLLVTDIEDYEIPHAVRVPKVLGREAWSPTNKRVWQPSSQQQHLSSPVAGNVGSAISGMIPVFFPCFFTFIPPTLMKR